MAPELMPPVDAAASAIAHSAGVNATSTAITAAGSSSAADERRARHRVLVKRAYHQKLVRRSPSLVLSPRPRLIPGPLCLFATVSPPLYVQSALQTLRAHERELDAQCRALRQKRASGVPPLEVDGSTVLRDLYARLSTVREELERENRALQRLARDHEHFHTLLMREAQAYDHDRPAAAAAYVTITPLSEQQCADVIRVAHTSALSFMRSKDTLSLGSEVFGWTHRYRFREGGRLLQYSIGKTFPSASACALSQRGWEIMTSAEHYRELHSETVVTAQIHLVQRVNHDNLVLLRVLQRKGQRTLFKTLLLASRFQVDNGYMTIFRAIDRHKHSVQQNVPDEDSDAPANALEDAADRAAPPVVWLDMFAWTYFEDTDRGVRFEFGGNMPHTSRENAQFWMLEVLLLALRWETKAVGPLFTLT